ncbi:transmembrane protein 62 [Callorhinchus milii]|nr:transmembrane protein 62 [Callorhinchus milii]
MLRLFSVVMAAGLLLACLTAYVLETYTLQPGLGRHPRAGQPPYPDSSPDNLFWFLQVSDIHISKFHDPKRVPDFLKFCTETIDAIKPELVLVTGDLTDAKTKSKIGSIQHEVEWQTYQTILKQSRVLEKTKWIDIRGNHDAFNIPSLESVTNYYRKYSAFRRDGSFHYLHQKPFGNYSFICADATPVPGPKRPFNFFGFLNQTKMAELSALSSNAVHSNQTIWFGHYTTSTIISASPGIRQLMSSSLAYLCGHLHTLGGLAPVLHSRHRQGTLELELGDWMDNRRYRILAFDHDLLSFADLTFDEWPVVLITNPKDVVYHNPTQEPLERVQYSTHIRVLVFSPSTISSVLVSIDGVALDSAEHVMGPLFVLPWNVKDYREGVHQIEVKAKDQAGREKTQGHKFTMEKDHLFTFDFLPSFILLSNHSIMMKVVFILLTIVYLILMVVIRYLPKPQLKETPGLLILTYFSLQVLCNTSTIYFPVVLFTLYTALGPWFIGEVIDGQIGACFSFGVLVDGYFVEDSLTFFIGILQLLFFNFPLTLYLCWCLLLRCRGARFLSHIKYSGWVCSVLVHLTVLMLFAWQLHSCYFLLEAYGVAAFLLSPMRTWTVMLAMALAYQVWTTNESAIAVYRNLIKNCPYS